MWESCSRIWRVSRLILPYRATMNKWDFVCYEKIVVELKAGKELAGEHRAQVQNYLRATGFQ